MRVRIIAGTFGGRVIDAPDTKRTHPMSERIRGAMFNSLGAQVEGARVLDVFAGSGSVGLEALSRGAAHVTFVERDRMAQKVLHKNIAALGLEDRAHVIQAGAGAWLETAEPGQFDLIFADPPYHDTQFSTVSKIMGLLKPNGYMVLSHPGRGELPTKTGVVVVDNRSYGNAVLTFYRLEDSKGA